ncbi:cation:dicarboxylate symporter family transporter [Pontibacter sp. G13]|uniref:cation:dicarboxylate symporter family transporter n=1 Tax=Pontibacter sp. G13 TaxID=3074898 RepID=UPI00288BDEC1|nr:cation:dicarboxylase symporter family transporter [Pontibacter sp. G13]WNJ18511.1 cation:dicarboxylase symporter family transporter [Pontibacter sp. G13]
MTGKSPKSQKKAKAGDQATNPGGLSVKILIGLILGILMGLFFGDRVASLKFVGDVFIGLLQMTVLPYILISLIVNIGRLSLKEGKKLITNGLMFMGLLLLIGLAAIVLLPLAFPEWHSASFYSASLIDPPAQIDFLSLYIPANPFSSLANSMVPAVVLFGIFMGIGMMNVPGKERVLEFLDIFNEGLNHVNKLIIKLTPYGVFAIAASTAGVITWEELGKMQAYLLTYAIAALILTFWVVPGIMASCTPFQAKHLIRYTQGTLLTIFATGKIIVVLPELISNMKRLLRRYEQNSEENLSAVDILMPLFYPFPNLGTLVIFVFVPFAAWTSGQALEWTDYPTLLGSTLLSSFVAPVTGIPFMLDLLDIPKDAFNLFIVSTVFTDRIRVVLGAMYLMVVTMLTLSRAHGIFKVDWPKLISVIASGIGLFLLVLIPLRAYLDYSLSDAYKKDELVNNMEMVNDTVAYEIIDPPKRNPKRLRGRQSRLSRAKARGVLRVGYQEGETPFTYHNAKGSLVGLGIEMAYDLARTLEVTLEFVPIPQHKLVEYINKDYVDIAVQDVFLSGKYAQEILLSDPYMDVHLALVAHSGRSAFKSFQGTMAIDTFTVGYMEQKEFGRKIQSFFPHAGLYQLDSVEQFFAQDSLLPDTIRIDALLSSAERGAVLTLLHPEYAVVNPLPIQVEIPLVFPLGGPDEEWSRFIDDWIKFKTKDGTIQLLYDHWILGKDVGTPSSWSILENVIEPKMDSESMVPDTTSEDSATRVPEKNK